MARVELTAPTRLAIFLATSGQSGVDRAARNLIPELARRGYAIDLLQVRRHGPHLEQVPAGVRVIDLGHSHVYACLLAVARYLRRNRPALLLTDKDRVNRTGLFARWLARTFSTRIVFWIGTPASSELAHRSAFTRWSRRFWLRVLYPRAHRMIADSPGVKQDYADYAGIDPAKIAVVPRPVVPAALFERGEPRPDHPWFAPGQPPVVLGVGELSDGKDWPTLLRAFAGLRRLRDCRLVIVGKGPRLRDLQALAEQLGVGRDVHFTGFRKDVYRFMNHAAVLALTSRREGLSFVLIEAMACGVPVVSTDCPTGPRAVLQDGRYGALVPVGDATKLCAALHASLERPLPASTLQEGARPYEIAAAAAALLAVLGLPATVRRESGGALS
jgi:glycosyltransferase involved in cell wall biosynthesis